MPRAPKSKTATPAGPRLVRAIARQPSPQPATPSHEQVEIRAYDLFLQSGGLHGNDLEHWLRAERELSESASVARPAKRVATARANAEPTKA